MYKNQSTLRVLFVCRGSLRDGLGHVMRSRTVALEMSSKMSVKLVVIGDDYIETLLVGRGLHYQILSDEKGVLDILYEFKPDIVVFDLTNFSEIYFEKIKKEAMTVSLSPIFNFLRNVDVVFNRTKYPGKDWSMGNMPPHFFCGLQYAVVRENCSPIHSDIYKKYLQEEALSIVISMGGADAGNKTLRVLNSIKSIDAPLLIWVLLGEGYVHSYQNLVECVKTDSRHEIILAKTTDSMWRIMQTCSLSVLAGGTITYESAYAGLPSINTFEAEAHLFLVRELVERGVCFSAGYPLADSLSIINANIIHLEKNREKLLSMHHRSKGLIDELGSNRITVEIEKFYREVFTRNIITRPASVKQINNTI